MGRGWTNKLALLFGLVFPATASGFDGFDSKSSHMVSIGATLGMPQLISGELRIVSVPKFEFGAGFGAFPINPLARSLYTFSPIPLDLQTGDVYNIYPSGSYSMSGIYAFARWFPFGRGWFLNLSVHSLSFTASVTGSLKDETLGTSVAGAIDASVGVTQPMVNLGPGYQFLIGERFHVDLGLGWIFLLPASSSVSVGGSLSNFVVLNAAATANYNAARNNLVNSVNQAMSDYQSHVKYLPSIYLSLGYLL